MRLPHLLTVPALLFAACSSPAADSSASACAADLSAPYTPNKPSTLALRDIVGLSSHPSLGADAAAIAERAFEWKALHRLGIHRMRTDFGQDPLEPERGQFDFSAFDPLVAEAAKEHVDLLALLDRAPRWAMDAPEGQGGYPPRDAADFATFAIAVADRYGQTIHEWEVWNEPNNGFSFWKGADLGGEPDKYGQLYLRTHADLAQNQACAEVACGSLLYNFYVGSPPDFLDAALQANPTLAANLDIVSFHPYPTYPPRVAPEYAENGETPLVDQIAAVNAVLAKAGAKPRSLWLTELGWPTKGEFTEEQHANYAIRAIVLSALAGADRLYLYTLLDGGDPESLSPEGDFGLMTRGNIAGLPADQPQPKPAFVAIAALLNSVGTFHVKRRVPQPDPATYVIELERLDEIAWLLWQADSKTGVKLPSTTLHTDPLLLVDRLDGKGPTAGYSSDMELGPRPVLVRAPIAYE